MDTTNDPVKPPRAIWSRFGGQLGVGLCALGFLLVFLGWNGAASVDRIPEPVPYLISGGVAGLCFVVLGVGMIVVQNQRADRAALQATLRELQASLERAGLAESDGGGRKPFAKPGPRPGTIDDTAEVAVARESRWWRGRPQPRAGPRPARLRPGRSEVSRRRGLA